MVDGSARGAQAQGLGATHAEALWNLALEAIADFAYIFDREGRFVYANQALLDLLQISRTQIVGKNFFDLHYPEDLAARLQRQIEQVFVSAQRLADETPFTSPAGLEGYYEYIFDPILNGAGGVVAVAGVTRDITARRRREQNAAFLSALARELSLVSTSAEVMHVVGKRLGAFLNVPYCHYMAIHEERDEVEYLARWNTTDTPRLPDRVRLSEHISDQFRALAHAGETVTSEDTGLDPITNGEANAAIYVRAFITVPFVLEGQWRNQFSVHSTVPRLWREDEVQVVREVGAQVFARFERARLFEVVAEREARLRLALEPSGVGLWDWDVTSGALNWSPEQERLYGLQPGTFGGRLEDFQALAVVNEPLDTSSDMAALERGEGTRGEFRIRRADGEIRWMHSVSRPTLDAQGRLVRVTGANLDVTELKRAQERLLEINEAQKRFVSDAAHELRAPLTSIQGNLELLRRYPDIDPDERELMLADASREAARLGRLVTDLLALARGDAGVSLSLGPVALHEVLEQAFHTAQGWGSAHRLTMEALEPVIIEGHRDRLAQLAIILLENALKYTPRGGMVHLSCTRNEDSVEFRVSDTGPGIAPEDLERVFERFYRADRSRTPGEDPGGTGLGLPIARWIAVQHGGAVWLESELGAGTTAVVRLPYPQP
jgi:PAS domain S-box-containing protein